MQHMTTTQLRLAQYTTDLFHFVLLNSMFEISGTRCCSAPNKMREILKTLTIMFKFYEDFFHDSLLLVVGIATLE